MGFVVGLDLHEGVLDRIGARRWAAMMGDLVGQTLLEYVLIIYSEFNIFNSKLNGFELVYCS